MTTGQKSLREAAEESRQAKLEESRDTGSEEPREVRPGGHGRGPRSVPGLRLARQGRLRDQGARGRDYEYVKDVRIFSGMADKGNGWKIVVDGVPFLFGDSYRQSPGTSSIPAQSVGSKELRRSTGS